MVLMMLQRMMLGAVPWNGKCIPTAIWILRNGVAGFPAFIDMICLGGGGHCGTAKSGGANAALMRT